MKRMYLFTLLFTFCALLSMAFAPLAPASRGFLQAAQPFDQVLSTVMVLVVGFASLAGVAVLVAALVNIGKALHIVQDGDSARWAAALNLLAFIGLVAFRVFRPDVTLDVLDGYAGQIAAVAVFVLGFMIQIAGSKPAHDALSAASIPVLGKSFTA